MKNELFSKFVTVGNEEQESVGILESPGKKMVALNYVFYVDNVGEAQQMSFSREAATVLTDILWEWKQGIANDTTT